MRFLCIYKPAPEMMETMGKFIEQSFKEGYLLATEGCLPFPLGARSSRRNPKTTSLQNKAATN